MKATLITAFVASLLLLAKGTKAAAASDSEFPKYPVVELTKDNFFTETQNGIWMIKFYVNWCQQCKLIEDTWLDLADKSKGLFHVGQVNCEDEPKLAEHFQVDSYPTVIFIQPGSVPKEVRTYRSVYEWLKYIGYYSTSPSLYGKFPEITSTYETKPRPKPKRKAKSGWSDEPAAPDTKVITMDIDNFDDVIAEEPDMPMIVKFYAPWCFHCQDLAPKWEQLAKRASEQGKKWRVGKVNADAEEELSARFHIASYPTVYVVQKGKEPQMYTGARTVEGLMDFMDKIVPPPIHPEIDPTEAVAEEKDEL